MSAIESWTRDTPVEGSSDRSFGFVIGAFFLVVACWPLISGDGIRRWALGVGAVFFLFAAFWPAGLAPLNRQWIRLGVLMGRVVSPIALAVVYLLTIVPIGWVLRRMGKDALRLRWDSNAQTYWIARQPPGPPPSTMKRQF